MTTRRVFLKVAASTLVAPAILPGCPDPDAPTDLPPPARENTAGGPRVREVTLTAGWLNTTLPGKAGPLRVRLRAYNGLVPGPIIETAPGEVLEVTLENELTPYDSSEWRGNPNVPHALDTTNLHTHGLDVIPHLFHPLGSSDPSAKMIGVKPGESYTYAFEIPDDHPAGLNWYHPHYHGSTAVQVVSGLAGLIVVRGDVDEVPEIKAAREEFLVISEIGLFPSEDEEGLWTYEPRQNAMWATTKVVTRDPVTGAETERPDLKSGFSFGKYPLKFVAVNGVPVYREIIEPTNPNAPLRDALPEGVPTIQMRPGEVVRMRVLNACSGLAMPLVLEGMPIHLYALDGVSFGEIRTFNTREGDPTTGWDGTTTYDPATASVLVLGGANRAEFLLKGEQAGTFELVQLASSGIQFTADVRKVLAKVVVSGDPVDMALPTTVPAPSRYRPLLSASEIVTSRQFQAGVTHPAVFMKELGYDFMINGKVYDHHVTDVTAKLGDAESWTFMGHTGDHAGNITAGHPFHVHVNKFEVKTINAVPQPPGTIVDTLWVSPRTNSEGWIKYVQFSGKTVLHCHILHHEDPGMMMNVLIEP